MHLITITTTATAIGAISGVGSWALFEALDRATASRIAHPWLIWLLPLAALSVGLVYHRYGGDANRGTSLVIESSLPPLPEGHDDELSVPIPTRMAPLIFVATYVAQLTGASVGREGAALQIGGSLSSLVTKPFRLTPADSRLLLIAAMAGAFGGAFGVPLAGAVFSLEVRQTGRLHYEALAPALAASLCADFIVEKLGRSTPIIPIVTDVDWSMYLKLAVLGVAAGTTARLFIALLRSVKHVIGRLVSWVPARPAIGGAATILLVTVFGREYLGLSLPLMNSSLAGTTADWWDPVLKVLFTAVALGCSIPGGEVTPLFVIGATLGSALSAPLGLPPVLGAVTTMAAVFAAAANTPIACAILACELFGSGVLAPAGIVCIVAYSVSPRRGIYEAQRLGATKDLRN